jgi:hypothetical protein
MPNVRRSGGIVGTTTERTTTPKAQTTTSLRHASDSGSGNYGSSTAFTGERKGPDVRQIWPLLPDSSQA